MKNLFARRAEKQNRSFTREILDMTKRSLAISFAGGLPDESLFPRDEIRQEFENIFQNHDNSLFQYSSAKGIEALREEIAKTYHKTTKDEILLTSGSQQGLDLVCKTFIDSGDVVVVESPSYLVALNIFKMFEADIVEVKLNKKGVDTKELERVFKQRRVKFFYTIPTFHNPTSWCWSDWTREEVSRLAKKYGVILIEDNPYEALRFEGEKPLGFDRLLPAQTVSLGTFSKTLVPDFRVGWIRGDKDMVERFQTMKENSDLQSSKIPQLLCAGLIKSGKYALHVELLKKEYRQKRDVMIESLREYFKDTIEFETPKGGMFIWVKFPHFVDTMELFEFAIREDVAFVPSKVFFSDERKSSFARLNFTNSTTFEIKEGIRRLKNGYEKYIDDR